jgi:hypothetical protein
VSATPCRVWVEGDKELTWKSVSAAGAAAMVEGVLWDLVRLREVWQTCRKRADGRDLENGDTNDDLDSNSRLVARRLQPSLRLHTAVYHRKFQQPGQRGTNEQRFHVRDYIQGQDRGATVTQGDLWWRTRRVMC